MPFILAAEEAFGAFALPDQEACWIAVTTIDWATAMSTTISIPPAEARRTA